MDAAQIATGARIAVASAVALLIVMFLPWFGVEVQLAGQSFSESGNAWEILSVVDILLFLAALIAIAVVVAKAAGALPALPAPAGTIVAGVGALAVLLVIYRLIDSPAPGDLPDTVDVARELGIFLGLLAAAGIAFGGYTMINDER